MLREMEHKMEKASRESATIKIRQKIKKNKNKNKANKYPRIFFKKYNY